MSGIYTVAHLLIGDTYRLPFESAPHTVGSYHLAAHAGLARIVHTDSSEVTLHINTEIVLAESGGIMTDWDHRELDDFVDNTPLCFPVDGREHNCSCGATGFQAWHHGWNLGYSVTRDGESVCQCPSCGREIEATPLHDLEIKVGGERRVVQFKEGPWPEGAAARQTEYYKMLIMEES